MAKDDQLTRRTFLAGAGALVAGSLVAPSWSAASSPAASPLGEWLDDDSGLPCYHYTGPLRFPDSASDSLDSSLLKTSGLSIALPWCAHAHAWPLYCYLRLRAGDQSAHTL